jgi:hypothetical protein
MAVVAIAQRWTPSLTYAAGFGGLASQYHFGARTGGTNITSRRRFRRVSFSNSRPALGRRQPLPESKTSSRRSGVAKLLGRVPGHWESDALLVHLSSALICPSCAQMCSDCVPRLGSVQHVTHWSVRNCGGCALDLYRFCPSAQNRRSGSIPAASTILRSLRELRMAGHQEEKQVSEGWCPP